jgi:hypothetical protein
MVIAAVDCGIIRSTIIKLTAILIKHKMTLQKDAYFYTSKLNWVSKGIQIDLRRVSNLESQVLED